MVQTTGRSFPQRLAMSSLAGLVVALLATVGIGAANATESDSAVYAFEAVPPMLGDLATYAVRGTDADGSPLQYEMTVGWTQGGPLRLPDGTEIVPNVLASTDLIGDEGDSRFLVYHSGLRVAALAFNLKGSSNETVPVVGGVPVLQQRVSMAGNLDYLFFVPGGLGLGQEDFTSCFVDGLGGQTVRSNDPLRVATCADTVFSLQDVGARFEPLGLRAVDGTPTLGFRDPSDGSGSELDFAAGIPYPLRVRLAASDGPADGTTFTMTGFVRGKQPLAEDAARPVEPKPALVMVERTGPFLVDDRGLTHVFPLSAAFAYARDDPDDRNFADWLSAHPDSVVSNAYYTVSENAYGTTSRSWYLVVVDRGDGYVLSVQRSTYKFLDDASPALAETLAEYRVLGSSAQDPSFSIDAPSTVMTSASLLALSAWHGLGGDCYGYGEPLQALGDVHAGTCTMRSAAEPDRETPTLTWTFDFYQDRLLLSNGTEIGRTLFLTEITADTGAEAPLAPAAASQDPVPKKAVPGDWLPSSTEAAGIGLFGLAAGLATFLWLTLKGGFAGMFSRVQGASIAQHPVRGKILQAIESQPGIHFRALQRLTAESNGNLVHHLGKLEREGLVRSVSGQGYTSYLLGNAKHGWSASPAMRAPGARKVIDAARAVPGASLQELARVTGLGLSTVHHHLGRLEAAGAVRIERSGHSLQVRVAD